MQGNTGKVGKTVAFECQRHQCRLGGHNPVPELSGNQVSQPGRPHLWDRLAPGCHHQMAGGDSLRHPGPGQADHKPKPVVGDVVNRGLQPQLRPGLGHLGQQHGDDVLGRAVAEQLAKGLFMPADAMAFNQSDKILRAVARQGGFGEMRVLADEMAGAGVQIGEIAAPATRNADLFTRGPRVIDHQYPWPGPGGAEQTGGPGPQDQGVNVHGPWPAAISASAQGVATRTRRYS